MCGILLLPLLGFGAAHAGQTNPGHDGTAAPAKVSEPAPKPGFWKKQDAAQGLPPLSASQIAQFLPDKRGPFKFPAPYNTTGIRVTLPSDCPNGSNCIDYVGYSYWATMSNSAGLPYMWILATPLQSKGGAGPTLYKLDKSTNAVTRVGPIFSDGNAANSGEMMYFSHSMPNAIYYIGGGLTTLNYINVVTHQETRVFDIGDYHAGDHITQCATSNDDTVSSCVLEDSSYHVLGCIAYTKGKGFKELDKGPLGVNECHVGAAGNYVVIPTNTSACARCTNDTIIWDLKTGATYSIDNRHGGGGHYSVGYGYFTENFNWDPNYAVLRLWKFGQQAQLGDVYDQPYANLCVGSGQCAAVPDHPSWLNAVPASETPIAKQYVCDSTADSEHVPFANQVFCYYLDPTVTPANKKALVIAPTMINMNKRGCPGGSYGQSPKGNIDPTGHYFMWSANLDSSDNCQIFLVKIPTSRLGDPSPAPTVPNVNITQPVNAASVSSTVTVKARVHSKLKISNVIWKVDNQKVGSSSTAPYAYRLDTDNFALGQHELTAVATNTADKTGSDTNTFVIVEQQTPPSWPTPGPGKGSGGGSMSLSLLGGLAALAILALTLKRRA